MNNPRNGRYAVALLAMFGVGSTHAALIDFTSRTAFDGLFSGKPGSPLIFTVGAGTDDEVTFTVTSLQGTNNPNFNFNENGPSGTQSGFCVEYGLACQSDGLGIVDDELSNVDPPESLLIEASRPVVFSHLYVLDLFTNASGNSSESAIFDFGDDGTNDHELFATAPQGTGGGNRYGFYVYSPTLGPSDPGVYTALRLLVGAGNDVGAPDYALAGFEYTVVAGATSPVPLPAAAWLFGSALLGVVGVGYRRRRS